MRVLLIGKGNNEILARMLHNFDADVECEARLSYNILKYHNYNCCVIVGFFGRRNVGIFTMMALLGVSRPIVYIVGSDALKIKNSWFFRTMLNLCMFRHARLVYVSEHLRDELGINGEIIPIPIDTSLFKVITTAERSEDVLYYCPKGNEELYRRDWIDAYMREHPNEKVTILDGFVPYEQMPIVYNTHKKLIRMTTRDGVPKMPYEALLCGCKVEYNGVDITEIPDEMKMEVSIPKLMKILEGGSV